MILPNSNTLAACEEFLNRTRKWTSPPETPELSERQDLNEVQEELMLQLQPPRLNVYVYSDASGEQRKTSASRTDWQIVKDFFGRYADLYQVSFRVPSANPPVKDRINCVNAMLRNDAGWHRLLIDGLRTGAGRPILMETHSPIWINPIRCARIRAMHWAT